MKKTLILSILLSLFSCNEKAELDTQDYTEFSLDTTKIAILSFNEVKDCFRTEVEANLEEADLIYIDEVLQQVVNDNNKNNPNRFIDLNHFKRQYLANKTLEGDKEVWVTCFCNSGDVNWKKHPMTTNQKDNCIFYFNINLTKKSHGELLF